MPTRFVVFPPDEGGAPLSDTLTTASRTVDGVEVPIAGTWNIDPQHSSLAFEARHAVVTRMWGRFRKSSGVFHIAERPEDSSVDVTIDAASIDTTHAVADEHLRGEHYLDVEKFPSITFRSTSVRHRADNRWEVGGDLTIRDITRPITLDATFNGAVPVAYGPKAKLAFTATGRLDRRDYGMTVNLPMPTGGVVIGNEVTIVLDAEADLVDEAAGG
jgi:polyisoprenoid-binding protein YceI